MSRETLLTQSRVWLFGRVLLDIQIDISRYQNLPHDVPTGDAQDQPPFRSNNDFLLNQLKSNDPKLARIFGFSFELAYYDLARPTIFLVHGDGIDPEKESDFGGGTDRRYSRKPTDPGRTGVGSAMGSFADNVKVWSYDRADFTIRLDMDSGTFESLVLSAELNSRDMPAQVSGQLARGAGSYTRSAGSYTRSAGSYTRSAGSYARGGRRDDD